MFTFLSGLSPALALLRLITASRLSWLSSSAYLVTSSLGCRCLDVGCGARGRVASRLAGASSGSVVGLDVGLHIGEEGLSAAKEDQHVVNAEIEIGCLLGLCHVASLIIGNVLDLGIHDALNDSQEGTDAVHQGAQALDSGVLSRNDGGDGPGGSQYR
jgi:hypothetical protein